jgi:predicted transcriptional regulator of viral defense system
MALKSSIAAKTLKLMQAGGVLRWRDLAAHGVHPEHLRRLRAAGLLERIGRGLYALPNAPITENRTLAEACRRVPHGVACLLTALQFHRLTTQWPFEVWLAIDNKARRPRAEGIPLRIVRFSGAARTFGVEGHVIEGVPVKVYSPAKTVADCFKYRHKIGLDVALEALRDCWRQRRATMDDLWRAAAVCRVANVMKPYLESLV